MSPKHLAMIAVGFVLAILIVVFVLRWVNKDSGSTLKQTLTQHQSSIEQTCAQSDDQKACLETETKKSAVQLGMVEACIKLIGEEYDGCVWEVADQKQDASLCEPIVNEQHRTICSDSILFSRARQSRDESDCGMIKNVEKQAGCLLAIAEPITGENCAARGQDPAFCKMLIVALEARTKQDRRICYQLTGDEVSYCVEHLERDDPDFDGISTLQETDFYQTDPYKADTDGDGYSDGDEVAAGYNPSGTGKLE